MCIRVGDELSLSVKVTEGVLQGEVLSPVIFALFLANLGEFLEDNGIKGVTIACNMLFLSSDTQMTWCS